MSIMELGALGEFIGSIGVIVTLVYLAVQIRQNTRSIDESRKYAAAQAYQARTASSIELIKMRDPEVFAKLEGSNYQHENLSGTEQQKFRNFIHGSILSFDNVLYQRDLGMIPEDMLERDSAQLLRARGAAQDLGLPIRPAIERYIAEKGLVAND